MRLDVDLAAEQVHPARLLLPGLARQVHDEGIGPGGQVEERRFDQLEVGEHMRSLGPSAQLVEGLGPSEHQDGEQCELGGVDAELLVDDVAELGRSGTVGREHEPHPARSLQLIECPLDGERVEIGDGIAVVLLVAGRLQTVERHRIGVGNGRLLLGERSEDSQLFERERNDACDATIRSV